MSYSSSLLWLLSLTFPALARTQPCTVNVADPPFSAVGDGVADDTAAIQNAINSINGANYPNAPSGIVCFPSGVFLICQISIVPTVIMYVSGIGLIVKNGTLSVQTDGLN